MLSPRLRPVHLRRGSRKLTRSNQKSPVSHHALERSIDAITAEVIAHRLKAVSEEMMATLVKTAYSPNIKERRDCSTAIFDSNGRLLALTAIAPLHLSSMLGMVDNLLRRFPQDRLHPGDVFVTNDPYTGGGSHLPDITLVAPVFVKHAVCGFVANIAHHSDVGGKVAGSESADCTSIFQEGLRLPPIQLVSEGRTQEDVVAIILLNSRTAREREGDLRAQIATNAVGARRFEEVVARFGMPTVSAAIDAMLNHAERRARAAIRKLPDGVYEHEDFLDNDGIADRMVRLKVAITIKGDQLKFDFAGTDRQIAGSRNMPLVATLSAVYYAVKAIVDPELPPNAGYFRSIEVSIPPGTVLNCTPPAAVGDRGACGNILGDVILGAFAKAVPDDVMAGCGPLHGVIFSGVDPRGDRYFVDYETYAGAAGAFADQDGKDAVRVHVSGAANLPIEAQEHEFPLSVLRYELIPDSGGAGKFRGGLSTRRDVAIWAKEGRLAGRGLRQTHGAPGLFNGGTGATGRFILNPGSPDEKQLPATFSELLVNSGSVVRIETPAGAGYGDPFERDPKRVLADVISGKVSAKSAVQLYGAVIEGVSLDEAETQRLRKRVLMQRVSRT